MTDFTVRTMLPIDVESLASHFEAEGLGNAEIRKLQEAIAPRQDAACKPVFSAVAVRPGEGILGFILFQRSFSFGDNSLSSPMSFFVQLGRFFVRVDVDAEEIAHSLFNYMLNVMYALGAEWVKFIPDDGGNIRLSLIHRVLGPFTAVRGGMSEVMARSTFAERLAMAFAKVD